MPFWPRKKKEEPEDSGSPDRRDDARPDEVQETVDVASAETHAEQPAEGDVEEGDPRGAGRLSEDDHDVGPVEGESPYSRIYTAFHSTREDDVGPADSVASDFEAPSAWVGGEDAEDLTAPVDGQDTSDEPSQPSIEERVAGTPVTTSGLQDDSFGAPGGAFTSPSIEERGSEAEPTSEGASQDSGPAHDEAFPHVEATEQREYEDPVGVAPSDAQRGGEPQYTPAGVDSTLQADSTAPVDGSSPAVDDGDSTHDPVKGVATTSSGTLGSPDDRIRDLFNRRREAMTGTSGDGAKTSPAAQTMVADGPPQESDVSGATTAQPTPSGSRPRLAGRSLKGLLRRGRPTDPATRDGAEPAPPEASEPESAEAPRPPAWEPYGFRYKVRQALARRSVTVSLERDALRVVVFKGREVLAWGTVQLDGADAENEDSEGVETDAERLRALLRNLEAPRGSVVSDVPLHMPLMRQLHLPKMRRRYVEQVVSSEMQDMVPFTVEEMDLVWQSRGNGAGHDVVAVALSNEAIDAHVRLLKDAGAGPRSVFSKAVALAQAAQVPNAIVAYVGQAHVAFVLVSQWVPQVVYELDLQERYTTSRDRAEAIAKAVEEVAGYAQGLDLADGGRPLPVVLAGEAPADSPLGEAIRAAIRRDIVTLAPPIVYPEHFSPDEYALNVGLMLADEAWRAAGGKIRNEGVPALNVLPERHLHRPLPVRSALVFVGLLLLVAVAVNVGERVESVSAEAAALTDRLDHLRAQERRQRIITSRAQSTDAQIRAMSVMTESLESNVAELEAELKLYLERLDVLMKRALPPGVTLTSYRQTDSGFSIEANASTYEDALAYFENLRGAEVFGDARLLSAAMTGSDEAPVSVQGNVDYAVASSQEGEG